MSTGLSAATDTYAVCERHCKVEGCTRELCLERPYYHRLGICAAHVREPQLFVDGQLKRFCQQCAKLHDVEDFDAGKRSCRLMLEKHKARRRLRANEARRQQYDCAGKELTTDNDPDREPTAAPSPKPTPLRRRGWNTAREVPAPTGGQSVLQFQLAHGGILESTMKTVKVVEGSPGFASCRDGISDFDGRSGSTCSQAETATCRASSSQQDGNLELNGVPATMPRGGEPGEQASSLVAPHVNQTLMTGQLLNCAQHLGQVSYDNGFDIENPGLNTRPGASMHVVMPVCTPLTRPDHHTHNMEGGPGFAASPSSTPKTTFSSQAVRPSPPQHLWYGPLDLQPLDAVAKMKAHRDAALDIELASLLSELDSQPIIYPPGTRCLASTSRPEYTNGGGYDGSGRSRTDARLHLGPCLLDKHGKVGDVGISPSFVKSGGMGASDVICKLRQGDVEVPAFPYSQLHESSSAVGHPTLRTPKTTVMSLAKGQTRIMQLPGCAPCSLSSAPQQSSLPVGLDPRPIRPQGWISCGTPLAAVLPPAAFSSLNGVQEPAQQPDVVNFQPPLLVGRSLLVHASLPMENGGLRQYSVQNVSCEQHQHEHSLAQLPLRPLWQQSKGELQQHCPWQEQQQYPCVNQQPETNAQSPWEVARSSLMRGSGLPEADGRPAQYSSTLILNAGQWQQQQIPPFQTLLQPQMQSPWPRSNLKPQYHTSPAAGAAALGFRQPKYK